MAYPNSNQPKKGTGLENLRGKKKIKETSMSYDITTQEMQEYLQEKINCLCANEGYHEPIKILLTSSMLSKKQDREKTFVPLMAVLSDSARKKPEKKYSKDVNPVFQTRNQTEQLMFIEPIAKLMRSLTYPKKEIGWHSQPKTKKMFGMTQETMHALHSFKTPTRVFSAKKDSSIAVWIDPIRVITDMLIDVDKPEERFTIRLSPKMLNKYSAIYHAEKCFAKRNHSDSVRDVQRKIQRQIEGLKMS